MDKKMLVILIVSMTAMLFTSCKGSANDANMQQPESQSESQSDSRPADEQNTETSTAPTASVEVVEPGIINIDFKPGFHLVGDEYQPMNITANAPEYSINSDLSNIENISQFTNLTQKLAAQPGDGIFL